MPAKELNSGRMLQEDSKPVIKGTVYRLMNRKMMKRVGKGKYMMK